MNPVSVPQNINSECSCVVFKHCPDLVRLELSSFFSIFFETSFFWPLMWCTALDWPLSGGQGTLLHVQISYTYLIFIHPTHVKAKSCGLFFFKTIL